MWNQFQARPSQWLSFGFQQYRRGDLVTLISPRKFHLSAPFSINYRHPPNYITRYVPAWIHKELHEIVLHIDGASCRHHRTGFSFSSTTVPQMVENTAKMIGIEISKTMHCYDVHFSLGEKQITETRCLKQHAFFVDSLCVSFFFVHSNFDVFRPSRREGSNQEEGSKSGSRIDISISRTSQRSPFRSEKGAKRRAIPSFWETKGAQG